MRILILVVTLLLVAPTFAHNLSIHQDNGVGTLNWQDDGRVLVLESDGVDVIHVTKAIPDGVFGLHQGDEIVAVDGEPVARIDGFLHRLRASKPDSVTLLVRRGTKQNTVTIAASHYRNILPPPPPEPPMPPASTPVPSVH